MWIFSQDQVFARFKSDVVPESSRKVDINAGMNQNTNNTP